MAHSIPPSQAVNSTGRNSRARILIADDHILIAEAFRGLLEPEFQVVGIVSNGQLLMQSLEDLQPDVVILDISMPELNGLETGKKIKALKRGIRFIYVSVVSDADVAAEAFRRGASGYVLKRGEPEEMRVAIRRALRGKSYISPLLNKDEVQLQFNSGVKRLFGRSLSGRQREILELIAEGKRMKEIANILSLKPNTIAFHKYRIMEQLGVKTNAGLIEYAIRQRISGNQS